jgi:hypothetical protein
VFCQVNLTDGYEYNDINSSAKVIGVISVASETYSTSVLENQEQTIEIDFQYNPSEVQGLINVSLEWNGTSYGYDYFYNTSPEHYEYNVTFTTPNITGSLDTISFYWVYVINYSDNTTSAQQSTTSHNQNITELQLANCSWGSDGTVLIFYLRDEDTTDPVTGTLDMSIYATRTGAGTLVYNWSLSGQSNYSICITPADEEVNVTTIDSLYDANGYSNRRYYFTNATASNSTPAEAYLYLQNESDTTKVTFSVVDSSNTAVSDVVVMFQRYYEGSDSYRGVAMDKTGTEGTGEAYLNIESIKYRIVLERSNVVERTYLPAVLRCDNDPCLDLEIEDTMTQDYWEYMNQIAYSCTFTNSTRVLRCEIIDTSGVAQNVCLDVDLVTVAGSTDHFRNCTHCSDVVMLYTIPENYTYGYSWVLEYTDGTEHQLLNGLIEWPTTVIYGATGLFVALMIFLTLSLFGIHNPVASIVIGTAGFLISVAMGFMVVGGGAIAGVVIVAGILIWKIRGG